MQLALVIGIVMLILAAAAVTVVRQDRREARHEEKRRRARLARLGEPLPRLSPLVETSRRELR